MDQHRKGRTQQRAKAPASKSYILVVGDWVVDEYWRLVRHHSDLSSHTGFEHYRSYWPETNLFMDLCGAGQVTRVLLSLRDAARDKAPGAIGAALRQYDVRGLGIWHKDDEELLRHLLHSRGDCEVARAHMRLQWSTCTRTDLADLANLAPALRPKSAEGKAGDGNVGAGRAASEDRAQGRTTRVVRLYHMEESGTRQLGRIDWDDAREAGAYDLGLLRDKLPPNVEYIVVQDFCKGVVRDDFVGALLEQCPDARWFVRTKDLTCEWIRNITDARRLDLLVVGPEVLGLYAPWESWLAHGRVSFAAKQLLDAWPQCTVALVTDAYEVVLRTPAPSQDTEAWCMWARVLEHMNVLDEVGWPSAFFAALAARLIESNGKALIDRDHLRGVIDIAVRDGITRWAMRTSGTSAGDVATHTEVDGTLPSKAASGAEGDATPRPAPSEGAHPALTMRLSEVTRWQDEAQAWQRALKDLGIIQRGNETPHLDVGRAATALPGYVSCVAEKRQIINEVGKLLRVFRRTASDSRSVAILLQADPGTGKTYLAQRLANEFDFALVRRDITQMMHRDEIFDLFDSVATEQANQDKPVLVFVDELNAYLDNRTVYGSFLAPLEDSAYVRRGRAFNLKPCAWIFAGTDLEAQQSAKGDKVSDFLSRMTYVACIDHASLLKQRCADKRHAESLQAEAALLDELRLEQVYLAAAMIHRAYGDVSQISTAMLNYFASLEPGAAPARSIRRIVRSLRNVQYGKITLRNLPESTPDNTDLVRLVFDPQG